MDQPLPLFHIEGERNLADLLTKKHDLQVSEVDMESEWQKGLDWMKLPTNQMPLTRYSDLTAAHDSQEAKKEEPKTEPPKEMRQEAPRSKAARVAEEDPDRRGKNAESGKPCELCTR